jgi:hypothetical protein
MRTDSIFVSSPSRPLDEAGDANANNSGKRARGEGSHGNAGIKFIDSSASASTAPSLPCVESDNPSDTMSRANAETRDAATEREVSVSCSNGPQECATADHEEMSPETSRGDRKRISREPEVFTWQKDPVFHGLILTKLRPGMYTDTQLREIRASYQHRDQASLLAGDPRQSAQYLMQMLRRARQGEGSASPDDEAEAIEMARVLRSLMAAQGEEEDGAQDIEHASDAEGHEESSNSESEEIVLEIELPEAGQQDPELSQVAHDEFSDENPMPPPENQ